MEDLVNRAITAAIPTPSVIDGIIRLFRLVPLVVGRIRSFLLGGSVVTETVFAYPGLGSLLIESVNYRDYPAIQSLILIFSLQFIVINLIVDILYAVLNPEIKLQ